KDEARMAYARMRTERLRQCIFIGTTNHKDYLKGDTGHRRFWPVAVTRFDVKRLKADRDQLWAEAVDRARKRMAAAEGTRLREHLWAAAKVEQDARRTRDEYDDILELYLDGLGDVKVETETLWRLLGVDNVRDRNKSKLDGAMLRLGWQPGAQGKIDLPD